MVKKSRPDYTSRELWDSTSHLKHLLRCLTTKGRTWVVFQSGLSSPNSVSAYIILCILIYKVIG